ncbi:MAG: amino acid ABC transporter substrate-binding protein, partial [Pseudomonadota bacterium]|nr:amino acid ABC transporter substrate-binding protein [Pseudomonadota bacterium]
FGCAGYDQINVLLLAIESAGTDAVDQVKEHTFKVANPPGETVMNLPDELAALRAGREINYSGASSRVDFQPNGMLKSRDFMLYEIKGGRDMVIERITSEA